DDVSAYRAAALWTAVAIGLCTIAVGQGVAELLARISATPAAGAAARTYLHIRNLGAPLALVYVALREVRYAEGDARSPMVASVMTGQAVGARRDDLVLRIARLALGAAVIYTGVCSLVFALGGAWIVAGFTSAAALAAVAVRLLKVAAVFQVFDAANMIARSV